MSGVVDRAGSNVTLFTRPRYGTPFYRAEIPQSYLGRIRSVPGVAGATPYLFFIGKGRREGQGSLVLGAEADSIRKVRIMKGVTEEEFEAFRRERTAAIVGRTLLDANDWRIGQEVTVQGMGEGKSVRFWIRGDADAGTDSNFSNVAIVHLPYLQEVTGEQGRLTFIVLKAESADLAPAIAGSIDDLFANFTVPTETISEKSFLSTVIGGLADALKAITIIGYLTLAATVLVVANTVAMSIRERTTEIGMLRTLGFGKDMLLWLVLSEAVFLSVVGAVAGSGSAWSMFEAKLIHFPKDLGGLELRSNLGLLLESIFLSVPVGLLAGLQPAWYASRLPITEALRHTD